MGANGRAYILQNLTRERTAAKYELVPESVLNDAEMKRRLQPQGARPTRADIPQNAGALVIMEPL
jgi:hypothetical protein